MKAEYCANCGLRTASSSSTCEICGSPMDGASRRHSARPAWAQNPAKPPKGSGGGLKTALIVLLVIVALLVTTRLIFDRSSSGDDMFAAIDMDCRAFSSEDLARAESPEQAVVFKRGYRCELDWAEYVRISESDYRALSSLIVEEFKTQSQIQQTGSLYNCRDYFGYSVGVASFEAGLIAEGQVFLLRDADGFVRDHLSEALDEAGIESELAASICDRLEQHLKGELPADLRGWHRDFECRLLPALSLPPGNYIFLTGLIDSPEEGFLSQSCWRVRYGVAYKGEWTDQALDGAFDDDSLYEQIQRQVLALYADETIEDFSISLTVYEYNGSSDSFDYPAGSSGGAREYSRDTCP